MAFGDPPVRVLVIPGLRGSGPAHWQSWLEARCPGARRVVQSDWDTPELARWSAAIGATLRAEPPGPWVAVAHSFGCLALAHHRLHGDAGPAGGWIGAAVMVAPASPSRVQADAERLRGALGLPDTLIASETDPWMGADEAAGWARAWRLGLLNLGDAGHINAEAGYGPLPPAWRLTMALRRRVEQGRRLSRASAIELHHAI